MIKIKVGDKIYNCPYGWSIKTVEQNIKACFQFQRGHLISRYGNKLEKFKKIDENSIGLEFVGWEKRIVLKDDSPISFIEQFMEYLPCFS